MAYGAIIKVTPDGKMDIQIGKKKHDRTDKGKSLLTVDINDYTIIDIETTGLDTIFDDIIELGALKIRNNKIIDKYSILIKPFMEIDDFITKLTGITNEMVANSPTIDKELENFINFIGNDIIIGHNVNFDINFIYDKRKEFFNKSFTNDFIDTLRISRWCIKDIHNHKLVTLAKKFDIDIKDEHRALKDCYITFELFNNLKSIENENPEIFTAYKTNYAVRAKNISANTNNIDINNPIFGQELVFTGTLDKFTRKEAMQIVANLGGVNSDRITKHTNYLVLGNTDYSKVKEGKSNKRKEAEKKILKGQDLKIISENVFYDLINLTK